MATINIVGDLVLDQSAGLSDDDVAISVDGNGVISGALDAAFLTYLNGLNLSAAQLAFADTAEAASQIGLVSVTPSAGETIVELEFSPLNHASSGLFTLDGEEIFLTTVQNGSAVEARDADGDLVAAFYIIPNADNTSGTVQAITFEAIDHPLNPDPDDRVDFSDILKVRALSEVSTPIGDDINVDDDGPTITANGTEPTLTTDDTDITDSDTANFAGAFTSDPGTDGLGAAGITYALGTPGGASGLIATQLNEGINLVDNNGVIEGRTATTDTLAFTVEVNAAGDVTLTQLLAVRHDPDSGPDQSTGLSAANLVTLTATIVDGDGDTASDTADIGDNLIFKDDAPSISAPLDNVIVTVDESTLASDDTKSFATQFTSDGGKDGSAGITYALSVVAGASGLFDTLSGQAVNLSVNAGVVEGKTAVGGDLVFTVSVDPSGQVTLNQIRSVIHDPNLGPNDTEILATDDLIKLTATITDKDGDTASAVLNIGQNLVFTDDAPTIVKPFDADPATPGIQTPETLQNVIGTPATGDFKYSIGADGRLVYDATHSDFGDANPNVAGVQQLVLTGTVDNAQNPNITNVQTALVSESATSAQFSFSFHYDKDPITAGVQDARAGGTLTFDKVAGTYSIQLDDVIDGFSFYVFHSSELLAKAPPGNVGHPQIVVTELDHADTGPNPADSDGFYVQFTANSNPSGSPFGFNATGDGSPIAGDTTFNNGQFVTSNFEDWVSATQSTNGVAGDTIQKGELLTLRFFNENILGDVNPGAPGGGTEKIVPTDKVDAIAIKFDGIGNAENLIVVLDLIDDKGTASTADDVHTTRSIVVDNADFFKGNTVPSPYSTEFSLDNNDGLVIIEKGDYNNAALGENFSIQGMQIMQSSNGLTGSGINLTKATDDPNTVAVEGNSPVAGPLQAWGATDNDVLKITDIGFIQTTSGQIGANLDFAVNIQDADGDTTGIQHLAVDVIA
ncbi:MULTISPECIES: DUF5801 repeats-in-toxin domain-containing protein [unclassified Mesorhizobium]|uniref:DUF5801 repeats-in-toxin domain-containing protein n=1 Tax=unclassified Mesorhizobium TaxID=325217 RepID=UPI0011281CF8|nr:MULTISPECIES: DUF5801 repeats-in-toxin domain-containing protein [unclassified Mesorhizobium]TPL05668.1 hypothetical protein FJ567_00890 [Mesorhizobium sp. B2-4-16]TPL75436.1 hypothetical protein FJ956_06375 [Mesorhizobium sp. B2-4-3]